jgi:hypothetical protein
VRRRIRERGDRVEQLHHRARPPVRHDQRQRVVVGRRDVDEVDVDAVDLGHELREGVQPRLEPAEVVVVCPVARELLQRRELHALRPVGNELLVRPARVGDTPAEVVDCLQGNLDSERTDARVGDDRHGFSRRGLLLLHRFLLSCSFVSAVT